jgi:spore coat polysaccharide biosynthesis predicted glycosyltransferase SpsG
MLTYRPAAWVVDTYRLRSRTLQPLRGIAPLWSPMDLPMRRADADGVWAPLAHPGSAARDVPDRRRLFGPRYALLPMEMRRATSAGRGSRVVVSFGAEDRGSMTLPVARRLAENGWYVTAVVGPGVRKRAWLLASLEAIRHVTPADGRRGLVPVLRRCGWAVLPPSQSMWEALSMGVPVLLVETASNQRATRRWARKTGVAVDGGTAGPAAAGRVASALGRLRSDSRRVATLRRRAVRSVDGRGAMRVAKAILSSAGASA